MLAAETSAGPLHYSVHGPAGAPWLVILHGLGGTSDEFHALADDLAGRWRVLLWDLPGHGANAALCLPSVPAIAEALATVLDHAGVRSPVLLGFSFGGVVVQAFVRRWPGRSRGLILYGCFAPFLQPPLAPRPLIGTVVALAFGLRSWPSIRKAFAARCAVTPAGQTQVEASMQAMTKATFIAMSRALLEAFVPDQSFRLIGPTLLIWGELDSNGAAIRQAMDALGAIHPAATRLAVRGAGHAAHLDEPEAFAAGVKRFLALLPD